MQLIAIAVSMLVSFKGHKRRLGKLFRESKSKNGLTTEFKVPPLLSETTGLGVIYKRGYQGIVAKLDLEHWRYK